MGTPVLLPKTKCCVSASRCERCPIRMLKEGTLPPGYGVRKRRLVRLGVTGKKARKIKKSDLATAVRKITKKSGGKKQAA